MLVEGGKEEGPRQEQHQDGPHRVLSTPTLNLRLGKP